MRQSLRFLGGWGIATVLVLACGTFTNWPLSAVFYGYAFIAVVLLWVNRKLLLQDIGLAKLYLLALPTLAVVATTLPSQWDEFTNWLPNQRFLEEFDHFPRVDLPPSVSVFPAYPFGLPLVGYFSGKVAGIFAESAGALFNTLLIGALAALCIQQIRLARGDSNEAPFLWTECSIGLLAATVLNPTFVPKLVFTTYVDFATAVVAAGMAWAVWQIGRAHV